MIARRALLFTTVPPAARAQGQPPARVVVVADAAGTGRRTVADLVADLALSGFRPGREVEIALVQLREAGAEGLAAALRAPTRVAVVSGSPAALAVHAAAPLLPMVVIGSDPVVLGLARSQAHPGGHVTGVQIFAAELEAKRLELLAEAVPPPAPLGALLLRDAPLAAMQAVSLRDAAARLGRELLLFDTPGPVDAALIGRIAASGAGGLAVASSPRFSGQARQLAALAREAGLPTVCQWREMAEEGCLMSYGPNLRAIRRRVAEMVAEILRGTPPGRIPLERPTRLETVVNARTARDLGIELPALLLARADEVIE